MAKKQITDLDELTEISGNDLLLSRDVSEAEDRKVTVETLLKPAIDYVDSKDYVQGGSAVADIEALKAIAEASRADKDLRYVKEVNSLFAFDADSTEDGNDETVIAPDEGSGRWILTTSAGGSGSGEVNYIEHPNSAIGWTSGGGLQVSTTTDPTKIPRYPQRDTAILLTPTSLGAGGTRFTLPVVDVNRLLKIEWPQLVGPVFEKGDYTLVLEANDQADYEGNWTTIKIQPNEDGDAVISDLPIQHFEFTSGLRYLQLSIHSSATDSDKWLSMNDFTVGPGIVASGVTIGTDEPYPGITCTITTNAVTEAAWQQVGDKANFQIRTVFSGTNTDGNIAYSGIDVDIDRIIGDRQAIGKWHLRGNNADNSYSGVVYVNKFNGNFVLSIPDGSTANTSTGTPRTIASGDEITVQLDNVPLVSLRNKGTTQYLTPEVLYASARVAYTFSGTNTARAPGEPILLNTVSNAVTPVGDWTLSDNSFSPPVDGHYTFSMSPASISAVAFGDDGNIILEEDSGSGFATYVVVGGVIDGKVRGLISGAADLKANNSYRMTVSTSWTQASSSSRPLVIQRIADQTAGSAVGTPLAGVDKPGLLESYEEWETTGTTSDAIAASYRLKLVRTGNTVHGFASSERANATTGTNITLDAIPERFRPTTRRFVPVIIRAGSAVETGYALIGDTGVISFRRSNNADFTGICSISNDENEDTTFTYFLD